MTTHPLPLLPHDDGDLSPRERAKRDALKGHTP